MIPDSILDLDVFLAVDCSQIEVRILAEISQDELLISQFLSGQDIHCLVGNSLTGWPVERIKKEKGMRVSCKQLHFGLIYGKARAGMFDYVVSKLRTEAYKAHKPLDLTGITKKRIEMLYDRYFETYKGVDAYIKLMRKQAEDCGYVESMFGQRRTVDTQGNDERGTYWGNQCINTPIQSSAHAFMLIALALLDLKKKTYSLLQRCVMEVHDALYFKVKLRHLIEAYKQVMHLFQVGAYGYAKQQFGLNLRVPLLVEASAGFSLSSMCDYEGGSIEDFLPVWRKKQREVDALSWEDLMPQDVGGI